MNVLLRIKKEYIALFLIIILAIFLRFWNLGTIPPSPSLDEQSIGWNAYSVLKTGLDEYKQFPLISQRGYDDYRRSTYLFFTIPAIAVFGLNAFAERLPAATLSVLTIFSVFWIVQFLFDKKSKYKTVTGVLAALLLTISPWHLYISRLGHESNVCLSFLVFGLLFFLWSMRRKNFWLLLIGFICFTISMIGYYSGQIIIPLVLVVLFLLYWKNLFAIIFAKKKYLVVVAVALVIFAAIFIDIFSPSSLIRFQGTSTFTPAAHADLFNNLVRLRNTAAKQHNIVGEIIYNRRWYPLIVFTQGYFSHFDIRWLLFNGGTDAFKIPNMGLLYIWEIPFILLGMGLVIFTKELSRKSKIILFVWFFIGPFPAAVATQTPHAMRAYNIVPVVEIFTACGLVYVLYLLERIKIVWLVGFALIFLYSITMLYKNYFVVFPRLESEPYQYAMRDAMLFLQDNKKTYQHIVVSNNDNLFQSYMFYLFYTKYDPKKYQEMGGTVSGGFAATHIIDNITFRPIDFAKEKQGTLLIGNPNDFPKNSTQLFVSYYLDGKEGVVAEVK